MNGAAAADASPLARRSALLSMVPEALLGLLLGVVASTLDVLLLPVTLYWTTGCPPGYCAPVVPRVHVVPLLAAIAVAALSSWLRSRRVEPSVALRGVLLGLALTALAGIFEAATYTLGDPYFTLPYRVYALAYVFAVVALGAAVAARCLWSEPRSLLVVTVMALATLLVAELAQAIRDRHAILAVSAAGAIPVGIGLGLFIPAGVRPRPAVVLAGLVGVAFLSRAFFGLQTLGRTGPGMAFAVASDDGDSYFMLASRLASDAALLPETLAAIAYPPGYSTFVAAIFALTGGSLAAVVLVQAALASVATWCVHRIALRLFGAVAALLAAALFALDQNLIQNQSTLTAEALLVPEILVALVAFGSYARSRRFLWVVVGALLLGHAFVTRNLVAMPLVVAVCAWLAFLRPVRPLVAARDLGLMVAAVLVFSVPIAVATARVEGAPRLTTQQARLAWIFDGGGGEGYTISNRALVERGFDPFGDPGGFVARTVADPGTLIAFYARAAPQRLSTLLFFPNAGFSDPLTIVNDAYYQNGLGDVARLVRLLAVALGIAALVAARAWRRAPEVTLLSIYALLYIAVFVFVFPPFHAFRYRIPVEPLRFIAEAGGAIVLLAWARTAWAQAPLAGARPSDASVQGART